MEIEPITFNKGLNLRRSPLMLQDGELVTCEGFSFDYDGVMTARSSKQTVNVATLGSIHSLHRSGNIVLAGDDAVIRYKWDLDGYCNLYTPENGNFTYLGTLISDNRWRVADYAGFTFIATEGDMYAFSNGYYFNCTSIKSPEQAPSVTSSGGSGSETAHTWYYTYVYRFKNGHQYESGLSPSKTVNSYTTAPTVTVGVYNSTQYPLAGSFSINGGIDTYAKAVYHFDGVDASTTITDSSGNSHSGTCAGNAQLDTAQFKFSPSSLLLDGSGDYVSIADHADFQFGTADFTIDLWLRVDSSPITYAGIISKYIDANNYWSLYLYDNKLYFTAKTSGADIYNSYVAWTPSAGDWYHVAFVRKGPDGYFFVDGTVKSPQYTSHTFGTGNIGITSGNVLLGAFTTGSFFLDCSMDELRISKGIARWTSSFAVPTSPYSGDTTYGVAQIDDGVDVFWKAYKTSDDLGYIYECYNGIDKTTLTATDEYDDSEVIDNSICSTDNYGPWPTGIKDVAVHIQRLFGIKDNKLYYSEPYLPFAVDAFNNIAITSVGDNLTALVEWGNVLYIASASTWFRLTGTSDDTWSVIESFSEVGTINRHTVKKALQGIVSLYHDGLYLFDGYRSRNVSDPKLGRAFFDAISDKGACFAEFHNNKYHFFYPSTGSTCDKHLLIDFTNYPDLKYHYDNFVPNAFEFHVPTGIEYYGDTDGYQYESGGSEVISTALQTGDRAMKNVMRRKQLLYLFYDIDTGGKDVTVSIYVDGTSSYSFTLNKSSRVRDRQMLPKLEGYRFSVYITCADSSGLYLYEPWGLGYDWAGE